MTTTPRARIAQCTTPAKCAFRLSELQLQGRYILTVSTSLRHSCRRNVWGEATDRRKPLPTCRTGKAGNEGYEGYIQAKPGWTLLVTGSWLSPGETDGHDMRREIVQKLGSTFRASVFTSKRPKTPNRAQLSDLPRPWQGKSSKIAARRGDERNEPSAPSRCSRICPKICRSALSLSLISVTGDNPDGVRCSFPLRCGSSGMPSLQRRDSKALAQTTHEAGRRAVPLGKRAFRLADENSGVVTRHAPPNLLRNRLGPPTKYLSAAGPALKYFAPPGRWIRWACQPARGAGRRFPLSFFTKNSVRPHACRCSEQGLATWLCTTCSLLASRLEPVRFDRELLAAFQCGIASES